MKKNFIKKLLIGGLITSLCLCCCFLNFNKNVSASAVNDYQEQNKWFENATFVPQNFSDINELKGKTFTIPINLLLIFAQGEFDMYINILERDYIGIEINKETHETIQCIDYLQYPYIIVETIDYGNTSNEYNIFSFYLENSSNYAFFYMNDTALVGNTNLQLKGSLLTKQNRFAYLPLDNIIERENVPLNYNEFLYYNDKQYILNYTNYNFLEEGEFLDNFLNQYAYSFSNYYFVFPNSDRYSLGLNPSNSVPILNFLSYLQPYNANINDRVNYGREQYTSGYNKGLSDATDGEYRFYFLTGIFNAISDILAIEIFPNVQIGYFILVPLALGITGMIFYFWRKD